MLSIRIGFGAPHTITTKNANPRRDLTIINNNNTNIMQYIITWVYIYNILQFNGMRSSAHCTNYTRHSFCGSGDQSTPPHPSDRTVKGIRNLGTKKFLQDTKPSRRRMT